MYFGYPLPNPYYKKGGGKFYLESLNSSICNTFYLLYPIIPAFLLAVIDRRSWRLAIAFCLMLGGSIGMWVLLSDEMNFGGRFQYPMLAVGLLSWYPLVRTLAANLRLTKFASLSYVARFAIVLVAVCALGFIFRQQISYTRGKLYSRDGRYDVAVILSDYVDRGYTLATTEAGLLPLYSRWRSIDTWGLNDSWIAHSGGITEGYLDKQSPAIIMFHCYCSPQYPLVKDGADAWARQIAVLQEYAEKHKYTLAAVFGISPRTAHYYYVSHDLPEHDVIISRISDLNYTLSGMRGVNYVSE